MQGRDSSALLLLSAPYSQDPFAATVKEYLRMQKSPAHTQKAKENVCDFMYTRIIQTNRHPTQ